MDYSTLEQIESLVTSSPSPPREILGLDSTVDISPPHTRRSEESDDDSLARKFFERTESLLGRSRQKEARKPKVLVESAAKPQQSPRLKRDGLKSKSKVFGLNDNESKIKQAWVGPLDWADGDLKVEEIAPNITHHEVQKEEMDVHPIPDPLKENLITDAYGGGIYEPTFGSLIKPNDIKEDTNEESNILKENPFTVMPCGVMDKLGEIKSEPNTPQQQSADPKSQLNDFKALESREVKEGFFGPHQVSESSESLSQVVNKHLSHLKPADSMADSLTGKSEADSISQVTETTYFLL